MILPPTKPLAPVSSASGESFICVLETAAKANGPAPCSRTYFAEGRCRATASGSHCIESVQVGSSGLGRGGSALVELQAGAAGEGTGELETVNLGVVAHVHWEAVDEVEDPDHVGVRVGGAELA